MSMTLILITVGDIDDINSTIVDGNDNIVIRL